jgi:hypothetical protein
MAEAARRWLVGNSMAHAHQRLTSSVHCGSVTPPISRIQSATNVCIIADHDERVQAAGIA